MFFLSTLLAVASDSIPVIYIGDSHSVGGFGVGLQQTLATYFVPPKYQIERYAVGGTRADAWAADDICKGGICKGGGFIRPPADKEQILHSNLKDGPNYSPVKGPNEMVGLGTMPKLSSAAAVVLAFGTNDAFNLCNKSGADRYRGVEKAFRKLSGSHMCIWVGPPNFVRGRMLEQCTAANFKSFVDGLKAFVEARGCIFVDSRDLRDLSGKPFTPDSLDNIHFRFQTGKQWGEAAATKAINSIRLNMANKNSSPGQVQQAEVSKGR